ncbi:MAG: hypothetical protein ACR2I1_07770, partial [Propionibacteriaceae bacterium]
MPVTETEEVIAALRPTKIAVGSVIANRITPPMLTQADLRAAVRGRLSVSVPELSEADNTLLTAELSEDAARIDLQRECHAKIDGLGL